MSDKATQFLKNETKKKHLNMLADYRDETLRAHPLLHSLFLEVTVDCNERCRHCGSRCGDFRNERPMELEEYKRLLEEVKKDFGTSKLRICITGGEPLLYKDFYPLTEYINQLGFSWGMTTNGTLIDEAAAGRLKENGMRTVSVSIDGLQETHDWFRQTPGGFQRAMNGIRELLRQDAFSHVQITTVIHHRNYGELKEMYELFSETGVRSWRVINVEPIGRAKDNPEIMLTDGEYRGLLDFIKEYRHKGRMEVTYGCSHYLGVPMEREVRQWYFLCNAGVYAASVDNIGDIRACLDIERRPELAEGNVRRDRLKDIWENGFRIYRSDFRKCGKCATCKEYTYCAGDSFHTWNFDRMEPEICMRNILMEGKDG